MRNRVIFLVVICILFGAMLKAQTNLYNWEVGLSYSAVDIKAPTEFEGFFLVSYPSKLTISRTINNSFSAEFSLTNYNVEQQDNELNNAISIKKVNLFYASVKSKYHLKSFISLPEKIDPYLYLGMGYSVLSNQNGFKFQGGVGINYWISEKVGITAQSDYNQSFKSSGAHFFQHSIGVSYRLGRSNDKSKEVPVVSWGAENEEEGENDSEKCVYRTKVEVVDSASGLPIKDVLFNIIHEEEEFAPENMVFENGTYIFEIPCNQDYVIECAKEEYQTNVAFIESEDESREVVELTIKLEKSDGSSINPFETTNNNQQKTNDNLLRSKSAIQEKEIEVAYTSPKNRAQEQQGLAYKEHSLYEHSLYERVNQISPISFRLDSSELSRDAKKSLDELMNILRKYPNIKIECGAHTDSRSGYLYNMYLSEKRALSIVKYLVQRGVSVERLAPRGYGESRLLNGCMTGIPCTQAQHKANRRVEFKIIPTDKETFLTKGK